LVLICSPAWAQSLHRSELPDSAYTVGKGKLNIHADGYQSRYGITDNLDVGTRVIPSYFGANLQLRYAVLWDDTHALSVEPMFWMEWPWAKLGYPSHTFGGTVRYSRTVGKGRLNLGLGVLKDQLKVTIRETAGGFDSDKGVEVMPEFSLTILRSPFVFHEDATKTSYGWDFSGYRMPIVVGYEHPTSDRSTVHTVVRVHPLRIMNKGSWSAEFHPSWSKAVGESFRFGLGASVLFPGMPFPVADEELAKEIEDQEGSQGYKDVMDQIPQSGNPVFVLPTVGLWWRI